MTFHRLLLLLLCCFSVAAAKETPSPLQLRLDSKVIERSTEGAWVGYSTHQVDVYLQGPNRRNGAVATYCRVDLQLPKDSLLKESVYFPSEQAGRITVVQPTFRESIVQSSGSISFPLLPNAAPPIREVFRPTMSWTLQSEKYSCLPASEPAHFQITVRVPDGRRNLVVATASVTWDTNVHFASSKQTNESVSETFEATPDYVWLPPEEFDFVSGLEKLIDLDGDGVRVYPSSDGAFGIELPLEAFQATDLSVITPSIELQNIEAATVGLYELDLLSSEPEVTIGGLGFTPLVVRDATDQSIRLDFSAARRKRTWLIVRMVGGVPEAWLDLKGSIFQERFDSRD